MQEVILYREIETPFGPMLGGATEKGCCLLEFKDRGGLDRIKKRILKRYKMEMTEGNSKILNKLENEIQKYFGKSIKRFSVPLDIKGTPFQKSVWDELLKIPYGETRSYSEIAKSIGNPQARRAVGRANGDNYIAIIIPCHRVIEANGNLRGYGGGLWRKKILLDLESKSPST